MIKKQKILLIVMASLFLTLLLLYFIVISPLMEEKEQEATPVVEPPALLEGEALDPDDGMTIMMYPYAQRKDIKSIEVVNTYGSFTCYRAENTESFFFKGYEQAPLSADTLASLVVAAGYTGTIERVTEKCQDWALYGLSEEDEPAYYKLTLLDGTTHEVYIGDLIKSGGGYYCRYKDRDAVYVVTNTIEGSLLVPIETLVTPYLGMLMDQNTYALTDEFILMKNGETFAYITYDKSTAESEQSVYSIYDMHYPGQYAVDDGKYSEVLLSFCTLQGVATIKLGSIDKMLHEDEELMAEYGFEDVSNAPYELYYRYGDNDSLILFAPSGIEGYYFAYSYLYNLIALVEATSVPYLEWNTREFITDQIFYEGINEISTLTVSGVIIDKTDSSNRKEINEGFKIWMDESNKVAATPVSTGKQFTADYLRNFKEFYMVMLLVEIQGYMKTEGVTNYDELEEIACVRVVKTDGTVLEYKYYAYSDRRCYVTVNGEGEFYVNRNDVEKMLCDANRAAYGLTVDKNMEYSDYVD